MYKAAPYIQEDMQFGELKKLQDIRSSWIPSSSFLSLETQQNLAYPVRSREDIIL
jgi:hypothetical protein